MRAIRLLRPSGRAAAVVLASLLVLAGGGRAAADSLAVVSARSAALGGGHVALADGFQTLLANPAGLPYVAPTLSFAELTVRATGPVFTLAGLIVETANGSDPAVLVGDPAIQDLLSRVYAQVSVVGPLAFGYVGSGMGFGVYNDSRVLFQSLGSSTLEARVGERFLGRGGYGIEIPLPARWNSALAVGLGLKGYVHGDVVISTSLLTLPDLLESIGPALLSDSPFELTTGVGLDVGLYYRWRSVLAAGVTVDDLYSPTVVVRYSTLDAFLRGGDPPAPPEYGALPQRLNAGIAFTPSLGAVERYVQGLTVLVDYRDALDFWLAPGDAVNPVLKFGIGVEARLLEILSVRGGFSEGLFAAGLGLDLGATRINAAMHGSELSLEPGLRPVYNLTVGLEFRR